MPKKTKFDAKSWAKAQMMPHGGVRCSICSNPRMKRAMDEVVEAMREGARPSSVQIAEMLRDRFGFLGQEGVVKNHLRKHVQRSATCRAA